MNLVVTATENKEKNMDHIYQVFKHVDEESYVVYETKNEIEAYRYCDQANAFNNDFTFSYYDVDC